jgi:NADH-quinone oxidoreductase subunit N
MSIEKLHIDFGAILPEMMLTAVALAVLVLDLFLPKRHKSLLGGLSVLGLVVLLPVVVVNAGSSPSFGGMVLADHFAAFFKVIFILAAIFTIIISMGYLKRLQTESGEYYYIILFATVGMMVMASSNDLLNLYVGLELMALSFYILVAIRVYESRSVEGALKYFVLGALSSGVLLYGISFAYGASGTTNLMEMSRLVGHAPAENSLIILALALTAVGFSFKVALFPFHIWAPDAYEGAPTPVTALLSVASKTAAFAVFVRVFVVAFPAFQPLWSNMLWILSAATMVFGSVVAISQRNIIRMLAYSSIAHAGTILIGLLVYTEDGISAVLYYLLVYTFMNMGAFTVVTLYLGRQWEGEHLSDYKGLASHQPVVAFALTIFLLSLAGVPPTGGFAAKFVILAAAINARYYWLAAIGVSATALALFFYAKIIFYMYMQEAETPVERPQAGLAYRVVLLVTAVGTMISGIYPPPFIEIGVKAIEPFFM